MKIIQETIYGHWAPRRSLSVGRSPWICLSSSRVARLSLTRYEYLCRSRKRTRVTGGCQQSQPLTFRQFLTSTPEHRSKFQVQETSATLHSRTGTCQNRGINVLSLYHHFLFLTNHSLNKHVQSMHDLDHVGTPQRRSSQLMEQPATNATNQ